MRAAVDKHRALCWQTLNHLNNFYDLVRAVINDRKSIERQVYAIDNLIVETESYIKLMTDAILHIKLPDIFTYPEESDTMIVNERKFTGAKRYFRSLINLYNREIFVEQKIFILKQYLIPG